MPNEFERVWLAVKVALRQRYGYKYLDEHDREVALEAHSRGLPVDQVIDRVTYVIQGLGETMGC